MEAERDPGSVGGPRRHLTVLVRLQDLDRERDSNQRLLGQTGGIVAARAELLDGARTAVAQVQEALKKARLAADEAELELRAHAEKVSKLELQLNTAKTNQEYQALQAHLAKVKGESSREEESTLALYERIEALEGDLARERERLRRLESEHQEFVLACERDRARAERELASTDERRAALLAELPRDLRASYERVRAARDGVAIVPCEERTCTGCGVSVSANEITRLLALSQIVYCDSCQRILYLADVLQVKSET
ncbi:MAG: hypothetical protein HY812_15735 [Planctomycetes bacterium]|nr:hypothetical protein [Planctomycetota bacterium]